VNLTDEYKKGVCQCRKCGKVFVLDENNNPFNLKVVDHTYTERFGQKVVERICPHCGNHTYGTLDYPVDEIELLFNSKFYRNNGKTIRMYLDKVLVNEV
jgi:hypothetical protein